MRIAHFIATNFVGGPEKQILNHISRLPKDLHAVLLISFDEPGGQELRTEAGKLDVECHLLPAGKWQIPQVLRQLLRMHDEWRPDVVCAHGYKAGFFTLLLKLRRGCRIVGFSRGWTSESLTIHLYSMLDRLIIRFADIVVAVSKSQGRRLERAFVPIRKIRVVENAVTISQSAAEPEVGGDIRQELGLPADARLILAAGRLSPEKGYADLLRAMDALVLEFPQAHLLLAGSGPLEVELKAQAARLASCANLHFLGFRRDMRRLFLQSDVFALSSFSEGLPNVVLEAMALGLPVAATRVGGLPEIIDDGDTGLLVPPQRPGELTIAMARYLRNPEFARQIAANARGAVYERFSPERQTERLLSAYQEALSK
jgi:glycosyltransferase involved in cell wall biosynthesis